MISKPLFYGHFAPLVSVIIVNFNQKYFSRMCVEAIEKSITDFDYEIIVVDNGSHDESVESLRVLHRSNRIHLVEAGKNLGYGKANNLGVQHAKGEFVIISNPDVFVQADTMQKLFDHLKKNPEIGLIGPRLRYYNGETQPSCRRHMTFGDLIIKRTPLKYLPTFKPRLARYLMSDFDHSRTQDVDLITGAYFLMRKSLYEQIVGFDPRYFLFMEDYDLCRKVHGAGYRVVYFPLAEAQHYHKRLSDGGLFRLVFKRVFWIHLASAFKYFWKWRKSQSDFSILSAHPQSHETSKSSKALRTPPRDRAARGLHIQSHKEQGK